MTEVASPPAGKSEPDTKGIAHIKPEFIKPYTTSEPQAASNSIEEDEVDEEATSERILLELGGSNKKKEGSTNVVRTRREITDRLKNETNYALTLSPQGMSRVVHSVTNAEYNHDVDSYLEQKNLR